MNPTEPSPLHELARKFLGSVQSYDVYTAVLLVIFTALSIVLYPYIPVASSKLILNAFLAGGIGALILLHALTDLSLFAMLRRFYVIPIIYMMYDQVHVYVRLVHPVDYDALLIDADRWLFGVDPTVWLHQFANPALTEYLQLCYFLFYLMPIMQAVELWRSGRHQQLDLFARAMAFCFFVSYLAYFAMPAIGPRFTLHDFNATDTDLPGLWLTPWLREIVNIGGGVAISEPNPADVVNRDCMPSGHTMMTIINIMLGFRFHSRFRWLFVVIGGSLILATVYLRYHYVVDLLVGALLALATLPLEPAVHRLIQRFQATVLMKTL